MKPRLTDYDRRVAVRGIVMSRLATGWVPLVRPNAEGTGEEEVWAHPPIGDGDLPFISRALTPAESELVSQIMREQA